MSYKEKKYRTQLQGQAGVWAVASQLALRGHVPFFPGVDYGYDILLDNGIRLQVKTSCLSSTFGKRVRYDMGAYVFDTRVAKLGGDNKQRRIRRDYSLVADFFAFWGVDENRFWIVPASQVRGSLVISSRAKVYLGPQYEQIRKRNAEWEDNWGSLECRSVRQLVDNCQVQGPKEAIQILVQEKA